MPNSKYFVGKEVENTPVYDELTLFVVGVPDQNEVENVLATLPTVAHIYFAANQSFEINQEKELYDAWMEWELPIRYFLDQGYMCTLDIPVTEMPGLLESVLVEYNNFIPMVAVRMEYVNQLGYNAVLKIDDNPEKQTNPGVWCHSVRDLMSGNTFTHWREYINDKVIDLKEIE